MLLDVVTAIRGYSTAAVRLLLLHFPEIVSFGLALMLVSYEKHVAF